jgi:hypothetical protein
MKVTMRHQPAIAQVGEDRLSANLAAAAVHPSRARRSASRMSERIAMPWRDSGSSR